MSKRVTKASSGGNVTAAAGTPTAAAAAVTNSGSIAQLLIGAGGIYACYLYYGTLQEDVTSYKNAEGEKFDFPWLLNGIEALANVVIGGLGVGFGAGGFGNINALLSTPSVRNLFPYSGTGQVAAKAFTTLALTSGLSFPVVTLAKSGKMVPVMIGQLLQGSRYTMKEYMTVALIIGGTVMVSMSKGSKKGGAGDSMVGVAFILASLACDGFTASMQHRIKNQSKQSKIRVEGFDMMFATNCVMTVVAAVVALARSEFVPGMAYMTTNPEIMSKLIKFAICSAMGQSFIFYTISNFDSLTTTTVTTTRKVFSVLLSIFTKGHQLNTQGWSGIGIASAGIMLELHNKFSGKAKTH
jgi:UDP-galactose transporter B1